MGNIGRQIARKQQEKREKVQEKLSLSLKKAFDAGFTRGVVEQSEADQKNLLSFFDSLEQIDGIGKKTAWKVREAFILFSEKDKGK